MRLMSIERMKDIISIKAMLLIRELLSPSVAR
jgi:hypothetical protein